jgi:hypothetical protein
MDEGLVQRLIGLGHYADALVVDIIAHAHQAWILPGLTAEERDARLYLMSFLNFSIWGDKIFIPGSRGVNSAKRIRGLVPNSLLAMHANVPCSVRQTLTLWRLSHKHCVPPAIPWLD